MYTKELIPINLRGGHKINSRLTELIADQKQSDTIPHAREFIGLCSACVGFIRYDWILRANAFINVFIHETVNSKYEVSIL